MRCAVKGMPQDTKRLVLAITGTSLSLGLTIWGTDHCYFQPRERARRATATAKAVAGLHALQQMATAEAIARSEKLAETATAQVEATNATVTAQAMAAQATATALAIEKERNRCRDQRSYSITPSSQPILETDKNYTWVTRPQMVAAWTVTNTGSCAWEAVALKPLSGGEVESVEVKRYGEPVTLNAQGVSALR